MRTPKWIWISTRQWTGAFDLDDKGIIVKTPPIGWKFRGWHYRNVLLKFNKGGNLLDWQLFYE